MGRFDVASFLSTLGRNSDTLPGQMQRAQELIEALPVPVFFKARDGRYLGVVVGVSRRHLRTHLGLMPFAIVLCRR